MQRLTKCNRIISNIGTKHTKIQSLCIRILYRKNQIPKRQCQTTYKANEKKRKKKRTEKTITTTSTTTIKTAVPENQTRQTDFG